MKVILRKSDNLPAWCVIERAEHDGSEWSEPTEFGSAMRTSARLGNADIEGEEWQMLEIAEAIEVGDSVSFKRCEAKYTDAGYLLRSPKNSDGATLITHEEARELAADIREKLGAK